MMPGDFVVHEEFGVGRYIGVRMVDLTPARDIPTYQPSVIIQYKDAEISFFKRVVKDKLWLYRTSESGEQELSTVLDTRKWRRRRSAAESIAKENGVNLVKMMAIRNGYHRTPCPTLHDSEKFRQFERNLNSNPLMTRWHASRQSRQICRIKPDPWIVSCAVMLASAKQRWL